MALNTLNELIEKKGEKWVDKFLSDDLIITEKLDTHRVSFERQGDKLVFFKKDNTELNLIERVRTNTWEDAIIELSVITDNIDLPEGIRFGISYTPVERPLRIPYNNMPKYVLTDITKRKNNKVIETYDYEEVNEWASILGIGRPPIIFSGKLSEEQKTLLIKYDQRELTGKVSNFSKILESNLSETYSGEEIIEGIVISNGKQLAQVNSYEFTLLDESYQRKENSRDFYDLVILSINSFMEKYNMPILESDNCDDLYLEIVSDIFNKYCMSGYLPEGLDPEYITPPSFGYFGELNLLLLKNKETIKILEKGDKLHEALFRVMLSSLKKQKKAYGLINESAANKFNTFVFLIENIINTRTNTEEFVLDDTLNESTSEEINEERSDNVVVDAVNKRRNSDVDNMRVIASIQKAFDPEHDEVKKGKEKAVIYISDCQPFTNSQMDNIISINRTWKLPVIIGAVSNIRRVKGEKFHFSDELLKAQLESINQFNKDIVPAYLMLDNWNLTDVFEYCRPKYEPVALLTDIGSKADFVIQLYFEDEVMGGRLDVDPKFNIGEMENKLKLPAYRSVEDNLAITFRDTTPQAIWGLWDSMVTEYKTWSGQIIGIN